MRAFPRKCGSLVLPNLVIYLVFQVAAWTQVLEVRLDGALEGVAGKGKIMAELGPGARFVPSVEGQGVEPGGAGPAVKIPVPDELWRGEGTLCFCFRPTRTIRFNPNLKGRAPRVALVKSPLLNAELSEERHNTVLTVEAPAEGDYTPKGRLDLSHFKGGQWYHLAFAWDAAKGKLESYLNGVLQEQMRLRDHSRAWTPPAKPSGPLVLGCVMGEGDSSARLAIDSVQLYPNFMTEEGIAATLKGRSIAPLQGEGRTLYSGSLDLSAYTLELVYEADFAKPLNAVREDELFEGGKRVHLPEGKEWVFEGDGRAWTQGGRLHMESRDPEGPAHIVLWNTRTFPADFLLEFGVSPENSNDGLNIVFFCARSRAGGSIFDLGLPRRGGDFAAYHSGELNCYHISYWACAHGDGGTPRRTTNLRKNFGFFLPACGNDLIAGQGPGPHRVRLLKVGGKIRLEVRNQMSLAFDDDGQTYGPVWAEGCIGLRQMAHTRRAAYTHFKVWKVR